MRETVIKLHNKINTHYVVSEKKVMQTQEKAITYLLNAATRFNLVLFPFILPSHKKISWSNSTFISSTDQHSYWVYTTRRVIINFTDNGSDNFYDFHKLSSLLSVCMFVWHEITMKTIDTKRVYEWDEREKKNMKRRRGT